jgi:opacity protein-like surface antigen
MVDLRAFALTAVTVVALSSAASAADLLPPPPAMEPPPQTVDMGGWYLRGDAGVGVTASSGLTSTANAAGGADAIYNSSVSEAALFDIGLGYQVNNWFRADVTGELRGGSGFQGLEVCNNCGGTNQYSDFYRGNISSTIALVNGYFDLGTWYGFTPFVGAGVGVAFNRAYGATDTGAAYTTIPSPGSPVGGYFGNASTTNLAWALMAGADMSVTRNLKIEFGYRFLDYGKFSTGSSNCLSPGSPTGFACGGGSYKVASKELYSNDFRIGLRYYFDSPTPPPEMPLVRKY